VFLSFNIGGNQGPDDRDNAWADARLGEKLQLELFDAKHLVIDVATL
jgi:hypothetical protein